MQNVSECLYSVYRWLLQFVQFCLGSLRLSTYSSQKLHFCVYVWALLSAMCLARSLAGPKTNAVGAMQLVLNRVSNIPGNLLELSFSSIFSISYNSCISECSVT